jgi:hypothetical protein
MAKKNSPFYQFGALSASLAGSSGGSQSIINSLGNNPTAQGVGSMIGDKFTQRNIARAQQQAVNRRNAGMYAKGVNQGPVEVNAFSKTPTPVNINPTIGNGAENFQEDMAVNPSPYNDINARAVSASPETMTGLFEGAGGPEDYEQQTWNAQ